MSLLCSEVQWANWVKKDKIEKLAYDSNDESWYTPQANKLYLTKLYASIETSEMKNDVFLTNAANNKSYPLSNLWPTILWALLFILVILVVSPLTLLYVIFMVLFIFIKPKTAKWIFWVIQLLFSLGTLAFVLVLWTTSHPYTSEMAQFNGFLIAGIVLTVAMIAGLVLELVFGKKKKII